MVTWWPWLCESIMFFWSWRGAVYDDWEWTWRCQLCSRSESGPFLLGRNHCIWPSIEELITFWARAGRTVGLSQPKWLCKLSNYISMTWAGLGHLDENRVPSICTTIILRNTCSWSWRASILGWRPWRKVRFGPSCSFAARMWLVLQKRLPCRSRGEDFSRHSAE